MVPFALTADTIGAPQFQGTGKAYLPCLVPAAPSPCPEPLRHVCRVVIRSGSAWPGLRMLAAVLAVISGVTGCSRAAPPHNRTLCGSAREDRPRHRKFSAIPLRRATDCARPARPARRAARDCLDVGSRRALPPRDTSPGRPLPRRQPATGPVVAAILRQQLDTSGFEAVDRVDAPDDRSVVFHLTRPDAFLIQSSLVHSSSTKTSQTWEPVRSESSRRPLEAVRFPGYYRGTRALNKSKSCHSTHNGRPGQR